MVPIIARGFPADGLTFVDAFAGPGCYPDGEPGSPLLALDQARRFDVLDSGCPIRVLLIEKDSKRFEHLDALISERYPPACRPPQWHVQVRRGGAEDVVIPALHEMGAEGAPIFVNFDGWGVDTPMSLVRHVSRFPSPEVLITFQTQFFIRFASQTEIQAGDRVFGGSDWRDVALSGTPAQKKAALLDLYRSTLVGAGYAYILTFELVDEGGHELLLIYGTTDPKGLEKMKDSVWRVDPVAGTRFRDPRDVDQMALDFGPETPNLKLLEGQLLKHLEQVGDQSLEQLKRFTLLETVFKPTHAPLAVRNLERLATVDSRRAKRHDEYLVRLGAPQLFAFD